MEFPVTFLPPLVRTCTDSGEGPWNELLGIIAPDDPDEETFLAAFDVVTENLFDGWTADRVVAFALDDGLATHHPLLFVVDERTLVDDGFPIVAADLRQDPGRTFRIAAADLWSVENNVATANMEFADYADHAELQPDRIFRGFC
ncbi:DUF6924 domain-containing protein [Pseudonocardia alni]|uniref:DUF6924 domain-containing protein n=1 Tax=Pseudonocardia alni TaxID=33907 RepID=A0A852W2L7_PSEA5|nr:MULTISPECIES: hypothetical protein [Pseudonocardia]MCO7192227.1 hypothetical protein [Pseudonocardia sp. McavD-2-B]MYW72464.1 hypothetical protein [Pseudonocardia sp. SID8383]NYG02640.1 hypothetical protein [Pseudonocardia antarctica]